MCKCFVMEKKTNNCISITNPFQSSLAGPLETSKSD